MKLVALKEVCKSIGVGDVSGIVVKESNRQMEVGVESYLHQERVAVDS